MQRLLNFLQLHTYQCFMLTLHEIHYENAFWKSSPCFVPRILFKAESTITLMLTINLDNRIYLRHIHNMTIIDCVFVFIIVWKYSRMFTTVNNVTQTRWTDIELVLSIPQNIGVMLLCNANILVICARRCDVNGGEGSRHCECWCDAHICWN